MTVAERTQDLVNALENNYKEYTRQSYIRNPCDYSLKKLTEIDNGTAKLTKFRIQSGRKYYKLIQQDYDTFQDRNEYRDGSVHAFINKKTGEVFKPASWKSPAKHVRYDLRIIKEREYVLNPANCGWAGAVSYTHLTLPTILRV